MPSSILSLLLAASLAVVTAAHPSPRPDVDSVFGFQELALEAKPDEPVEAVADPTAVGPGVERAYVEDVQLGERRLRVYVTLFEGEIESIELQPIDSGDLSDLYADLVGLYGPPTHHNDLETRWEGKKARLTWVSLYGNVVITLTSRRLERAMKKAQSRE